MTAATMNTIWSAAGKSVVIEGETRSVLSRRLCYGMSIEITLDRPLSGCSSRLYTVTPSNVATVQIVD